MKQFLDQGCRSSMNLVFVFADQMRGMDMRCAGNADVHTPNLDQLAHDGLRFTRAIANSPVCGPNRASMLTGLLPPNAGVPVNDLPMTTGLPSLGTISKANGWQTAYIGKWHLDGLPRDKFTPPGARRSGFDYWAAFNCSHDYFTPRYYRDTPALISTEGYEPEVQTSLAIDFLQTCAKDQPFCLTLSWGPPHDPYWMVPGKYRKRYDADHLTLRPNCKPDAPNPLAAGLDCRETHADYYAAITALDEQLGRLRSTLRELRLAENTLIVFTSDHGDMLWSHGWMKKQAPYAESLSVPLIIHHPRLEHHNATNDTPFGSIDLLPTLCGLMGWKNRAVFDGEDLSELCRTPSVKIQRSLLIAHYVQSQEASTQNMPEWRGIYDDDHTYVEKTPGQPWLFFDNQNDPFQLQNLTNQPHSKPIQQTYTKLLHNILLRKNDPFLPGEAYLAKLGLSETALSENPRYSPDFQKEMRRTMAEAKSGQKLPLRGNTPLRTPNSRQA